MIDFAIQKHEQDSQTSRHKNRVQKKFGDKDSNDDFKEITHANAVFRLELELYGPF